MKNKSVLKRMCLLLAAISLCTPCFSQQRAKKNERMSIKLKTAHDKVKLGDFDKKVKHFSNRYMSQIQLDTINYAQSREQGDVHLEDVFFDNCVELYSKVFYKAVARDQETRLKGRMISTTATTQIQNRDLKIRPRIKVSHGKVLAQVSFAFSSDPNSRLDDKSFFVKANDEQLNFGAGFSWGNFKLGAIRNKIAETNIIDNEYSMSATVFLDMRQRKTRGR